jgi:nitrate/TMAO reductase-like tetraheme cytochrome c subunit
MLVQQQECRILRGGTVPVGGDAKSDEVRAGRPAATGRGSTRAQRLIMWGAIGVAALILLAGSLVYTEQSSFCPTCHEMGPYYQAWAAGGHAKKAQCVDCHVDAGVIAHLAHKPIALKEVWDHFFADNRFPSYTLDVPNSRCVHCHPTVPDKIGALFSHALHQTKATCKDCHAQSGHVVSLASLSAAGILRANAVTPTVTGVTPSSIAGHIKVVCQDCHDQATMRCSSCHQPPHESRGECSNCHEPGTKFAFTHSSSSDCGSCHTPPANHFGPDCKACHNPNTPFAKAAFTHPARVGEHNYRAFPCVKCHPNGYSTSSCTCHGGRAPSGD